MINNRLNIFSTYHCKKNGKMVFIFAYDKDIFATKPISLPSYIMNQKDIRNIIDPEMDTKAYELTFASIRLNGIDFTLGVQGSKAEYIKIDSSKFELSLKEDLRKILCGLIIGIKKIKR